MTNNQTGHRVRFTDVQRREIIAEVVSKDGVEALSVDKLLPGGSTQRLLLLNKYDAQKLKEALEFYLNNLYAKELSGMEGTLSPADMFEIFGDEDEDGE